MGSLRPVKYLTSLVVLLGCIAPQSNVLAQPSTAQTTLTRVASALDDALIGAKLLDPATATWLESALMDWRAFDATWILDASQTRHQRPIYLIRAIRLLAEANPTARHAALMLAEQIRVNARTEFELFCAYLLADPLEPKAAQDDPFHPDRADEVRMLKLSLEETRMHLRSPDGDPTDGALRAAFARGDDRELLARFKGLAEPEWPQRVEALLHRRDPVALRSWVVRAETLIRLRHVRARYAGLID